MQSWEREREIMWLMFTIRKTQCVLLVGVHAVVTISNSKVEGTEFLILWPAPPVRESGDRRSWSPLWGWAHCSSGEFSLEPHLGWCTWLHIYLTAIPLGSCSVEKDGCDKAEISESWGLFVIVVYQLNYAFIYGGKNGWDLSFWRFGCLTSICSPNSTTVSFWGITSSPMPRSGRAGHQGPCLPLAKGQAFESN